MLVHYIQQLRGLAIILIVVTHAMDPFDWSERPLTALVLKTVAVNGTLIFVFIAGFLFQHLLPRYEPIAYLRGKLRNVIVPYLILGAPAIVLVLSGPSLPPMYPKDMASWSLAGQIVWFYATGAMLGPFWFIPMIAIIYLLAPVLAWADRDQRFYWLLPALLIVSIVLPRPAYNLDPLHALALFLPIYVLGMAVSRYRDVVIPRCQRACGVLFGLTGALILIQIALVLQTGKPFNPLTDPTGFYVINLDTVQKTLLTFALLGLLSRHEGAIGARFDELANASFSIYFLHYYFVQAQFVFITQTSIWPPASLLAVTALSALAIIAPMAFARWVRLRAGRNASRMLVGS
ncbi:MAG: acyltransferase family protein [Alphaproteobacteria bacterium]|nr:acyltransferase family protein [Alphaproteobacteria bacterium]